MADAEFRYPGAWIDDDGHVNIVPAALGEDLARRMPGQQVTVLLEPVFVAFGVVVRRRATAGRVTAAFADEYGLRMTVEGLSGLPVPAGGSVSFTWPGRPLPGGGEADR